MAGKTERKPVAMYNSDGKIIKLYPSISAAARDNGYYPYEVSLICHNTKKTQNDYTFRFIDEEETLTEKSQN